MAKRKKSGAASSVIPSVSERPGREGSRNAPLPPRSLAHARDDKAHRSTRFLLIISVVALLLLAGWLAFPKTKLAARFHSSEPDVILITIDTLRADSVGFAGNTRVKTPFLDELAREGHVFTNAHAHNVVTLASHTNILTGLYPYQHGVRDNSGFKLAPSQKTIAHWMHAKGYATGAFVGAFPLDSRFGLGREFDVYDDRYHEGSTPMDFSVDERRASEVLEAARKWYDTVADKKKFLWIHLYDPHAPYNPPAPFKEQFRDNPYLGEISYTDSELEKFLRPILAARPDTMIVITADHGEAMGEHGELTHGLFTYEATLKVPMLVYEKGDVAPAKDDRVARHIDIVPTILARVGIDKPKELPGMSLLADRGPDDSYFESLSSFFNRGWAPITGVIQQQKKFIDVPIPELYHLASDPLRTLLTAMAPNRTDVAPSAISNEERAKLLALGYITGASGKKSGFTAADDPKNLVALDRKMHDVVASYEEGNVPKALQLAQEVVRERPDMANAYDMLAFVLQQSERLPDAARVLREAYARGLRDDQMQMRLGMILTEMGNAPEAVDLLRPYVDREDPDVLNAYGLALAGAGHAKEAYQVFDRIATIDPTNAKSQQNYGVVALQNNDAAAAHEHLQRALALNPNLPITLNTLGVLYAREGQYQAAIPAWSKAISLDRRQYDAMYNLALVAGQQHQWEVCIKALNQFISTAPPERYARDIEKARAMRTEAGRRMSQERGAP
jgi:arylsulfatase A-like enzyme/tetratricopeptide (TPR) repeat protein